MTLPQLTDYLRSGGVLSEAQCLDAVQNLLDYQLDETAKASFLMEQSARGLRLEELVGFSKALIPRAVSPGFTGQWNGTDIIDCCGTGGGGLNIFNISTGMIFILAAAGVPVVKHGNRGMTKKSGSADVLEALGIKIDLKPDQLRQSMDSLGWAFVFAPHYHPAVKAVTEVRRKLGATGQKTIFNFLGPLINPVQPKAQLVGVFDQSLLELYHRSLQMLGRSRACVVYGTDNTGRPIGEVSPYCNTVSPASFQPAITPAWPGSLESIMISDARDGAERLDYILQLKERGLGYRILVENAGMAFWVQGRVASYLDGVAFAEEVLASKAAYRLLKRSQEWSQNQK